MCSWFPLLPDPMVLSKFLNPLLLRIPPVLLLTCSYLPLCEKYLPTLTLLLRSLIQSVPWTSCRDGFHLMSVIMTVLIFLSTSNSALLTKIILWFSYWYFHIVNLWVPEFLLIPKTIVSQGLHCWKYLPQYQTETTHPAEAYQYLIWTGCYFLT